MLRFEKLISILKENKAFFLLLACIVVSVTTYSLILPAFTLEKDKAVKQGGISVDRDELADRSGAEGKLLSNSGAAGNDSSNKDNGTAGDDNNGGAASDDPSGNDSIAAGDVPSDKENVDAEGDSSVSGSEDNADKTQTDKEALFEGDGFSVRCVADEPGDLSLDVKKIGSKDAGFRHYTEKAEEAVEQAFSKAGGRKRILKSDLYNITLLNDNDETEPESEASVVFEYDKDKRVGGADDVRIVHFAVKDGKESVEVLSEDDTEVKSRRGKVEQVGFTTDSFSVYAIVYTVDFSYDIDGETYEYSMKGGSSIMLSDLLSTLKVVDPDDITQFMADISQVEFSDDKLIKIEGVTSDEDQAAGESTASDSQSVEASESTASSESAAAASYQDYKLISLKPFDTEEQLTIRLCTGETFVIKVTDAQIPDNLRSNLLAYFDFDSYLVSDSSGNNARLFVDDNKTVDNYLVNRGGYIGNSYFFDNGGNDKYSLQLTNSSGGSLLGSSTEATISFWAKPTGAGTPNWAFYVADDEQQRQWTGKLNYIGEFNTNGEITAELRHSNPFVDNQIKGNAALNEWHSVVVTYTANKMSLYVDGVLIREMNTGTSLQQAIGSSSIFQIGKANWGNGEYYNGYIDEFAVFNRALTAAEIQSLYNDTYKAGGEDLEKHRATKVKVTDLEHNDEVIIYNTVWNASKNDFDYYAIDGNGNLVELKDSGDSIYWKGDPSLIWKLTVHTSDGNENGYYELYNPATGKYLNPQHDQIFSSEGLGINLNGRREGRYGSVIEKWDGDEMSYYGYKYDNGQLVTASSTAAANDKDWEFYFAIPSTPTGQLETVETINNPQGLTIQMFDYSGDWDNTPQRIQYMSDVLGYAQYNDGKATQGILKNYYDYKANDAFPIANYTNSDIRRLFTNASTTTGSSVGGQVDNLFIKSIYDETGYYEYSAFDNYAYLDPGTNEFTVYKQIGNPKDNVWDPSSFYYERGNFTPYNAIDASLTSQNTNMFDDNGNALLPSDPRYGEALYQSPSDETNYFFGMSVEAHFEMPKDGKDERNDDITYEFNGDDDMWVYIDGVLVLDLGGVHDARGGVINFTTGQIVYAFPNENNLPTTIKDCYRAAGHFPDGTTWDESRAGEYFDGNTFKDFTTHTMNMFYMERGMGASNLHMRFNLPIIEPGSFSVEKKLEGANEDYANQKFAYQAYRVINGQQPQIIRPDSNISCVYEGTEPPVNVQFDPDGTFYLKPGEKAVFEGLDQGTEYYVIEKGINNQEYSVTINGDPAQIQNGGIVQSTTEAVYMRSHLQYGNRSLDAGALNLTKRVLSGDDPGATFEFYLYFENTAGDIVPYSNGVYYVKKDNVYYEYSGGNLIRAVDQSNPHYYKAGPYGAIANIPADFTIEVRELLPGTHFLALERLDTMPEGYEYVDKILIDDTYAAPTTDKTYQDTAPDGKIKSNTTAKIEISNIKTGDLELKKLVTGAGADQTMDFEFTIELTAPAGKTLAESYKYTKTGVTGEQTLSLVRTDGNTTGTGTVTLKHGDVILIKDLPAGTHYKITELDYSNYGYSPQTTSTDGLEGTITGGAESTDEHPSVEVTNTHLTGGLVVEKFVSGSGGDPNKGFSFEVTIVRHGSASGEHGHYVITNSAGQDGQPIPVVFNSGTAVVSFTLKHHEKATFSGLQNKAEFTIRELSADQDGYSTTLTNSGGTVSGKVLTGSISNTATVTADYDNHKDSVALDILKRDKEDSSTHLSGAKFELDQIDGDSTSIDIISGKHQEVETGSDGKAVFTNLEEGYYQIVETKAPAGYILPDEATYYIHVTGDGIVLLDPVPGTAPSSWSAAANNIYNDGSITAATELVNARLTVDNTPGAELPSAGGPGTTWIYILGALLAIGCSIAIVARQRCRR